MKVQKTSLNETIQQLDLDGKPLDIHHIFPQQWCKEKGIKPAVYDSIINKTLYQPLQIERLEVKHLLFI